MGDGIYLRIRIHIHIWINTIGMCIDTMRIKLGGLEFRLIAFSTNNVIGTHTNAVVCVTRSNPIPLYSVWPDILVFVHY